HAAAFAVDIQGVVVAVLAEGHLGGHAPGGGTVEVQHFFGSVATVHVPAVDGLAQRAAVHIADIQIEQAGTGQFAQNAEDAAGAVDVFHMVFVGGGRDLAQARHAARNTIDVRHG